jgi:type IX secretion system substrate protein
MKHSKIIAVTIICGLMSLAAGAQSIDKSVVAVNGGSFSGSGIQVDWTIGQPVINSTSSTIQVTQGFLPISDNGVAEATPILNNAANLLSVKAYPNPVSNILHVSIQQNTAGSLWIQVTDLLGKTVKTASPDAQLNTDVELDMSSLASGMYYLTVNISKENAQVMKIVKN